LFKVFWFIKRKIFMPTKTTKATKTAKPEATRLPSESKVTIVTAESLLSLAVQEPPRRELAEFSEVIRVLRDDKGFTFREIAAWLSHYAFETDHNAVYREYTKGMHPNEAEAEAHEDMATEIEERGH
jgi:hypothetical protein